MTLPTPKLATNAAAAYLAGLGNGSRITQAKAIRTVCRIVMGPDAEAANFPWHAVTFAHSAALRQVMANSYAPATTNRMLAAWRGVLKAAWRLNQLDDATYLRAVDVQDVRLSGHLRGRALPDDERRQLFDQARNDSRPLGKRDAAMLALLYGCGLRRAEASGLNLENVQSDGIHVRGKGGKVRIVPVPPAFQEMLRPYLDGLADGPLLRSIDRSTGALMARRLTVDGIAKALTARAHAIGIQLTPHDLRRTYITNLLNAGTDPLTVAGLAGHERIDTTRKYDRRPHAARVAAVAALGD
jgi:site-specific recombinase XerD